MGTALSGAASQAWPPFVLVAGLLLIGAVAQSEGLFAALGTRAERIRGGPVVLLAVLLGLEAVVTALLNLDTAVVFLTPVLVHAARQRACDERPFLYGALFMANGASILLPGSNLTNLIVLDHESLSGAELFRAMAVPWIVVVVLTIAVVAVAFRPRHDGRACEPLPPLRFGVGATASLVATALIPLLRNPALPVLAVGAVAVGLRRLRPRIDAPVLLGLFALAVTLGTLARSWDGPASLLRYTGGLGAALVGAFTSIVVNNLPAASLLAAQRPPHPLPLLLGLDLGPNLLFTGSLSAYLWWRAARATGAEVSFALATKMGLILVPVTMAGALGVLAVTRPGAL